MNLICHLFDLIYFICNISCCVLQLKTNYVEIVKLFTHKQSLRCCAARSAVRSRPDRLSTESRYYTQVLVDSTVSLAVTTTY